MSAHISGISQPTESIESIESIEPPPIKREIMRMRHNFSPSPIYSIGHFLSSLYALSNPERPKNFRNPWDPWIPQIPNIYAPDHELAECFPFSHTQRLNFSINFCRTLFERLVGSKAEGILSVILQKKRGTIFFPPNMSKIFLLRGKMLMKKQQFVFAMKCLRVSIYFGSPEAYAEAALLLMTSREGFKSNTDEGICLLREGNLRHPGNSSILGMLSYYLWKGYEKPYYNSPEKDLEAYDAMKESLLIDPNNCYGKFASGCMHLYGFSSESGEIMNYFNVRRDIIKSFSNLRIASREIDVAKFHMANMIRSRAISMTAACDDDENDHYAFNLFKELVTSGFPPALIFLARYYETGLPRVPRNLNVALDLFRRSIKLRDFGNGNCASDADLERCEELIRLQN